MEKLNFSSKTPPDGMTKGKWHNAKAKMLAKVKEELKKVRPHEYIMILMDMRNKGFDLGPDYDPQCFFCKEPIVFEQNADISHNVMNGPVFPSKEGKPIRTAFWSHVGCAEKSREENSNRLLGYPPDIRQSKKACPKCSPPKNMIGVRFLLLEVPGDYEFCIQCNYEVSWEARRQAEKEARAQFAKEIEAKEATIDLQDRPEPEERKIFTADEISKLPPVPEAMTVADLLSGIEEELEEEAKHGKG